MLFWLRCCFYCSFRKLKAFILAIVSDSCRTCWRFPLEVKVPFLSTWELSKTHSIFITWPTKPATLRILTTPFFFFLLIILWVCVFLFIPGGNFLKSRESASASNWGTPRYFWIISSCFFCSVRSSVGRFNVFTFWSVRIVWLISSFFFCLKGSSTFLDCSSCNYSLRFSYY